MKKIKDFFIKLWNWVKKPLSNIGKFLSRLAATALIIFLAWYGFLYLVDDPPIDTNPALIMVWVSAILLLISMFPQIFDRLKKIKFKDFELELQETIEKITEEPYISNIDLRGDLLLSRKGNWRDLERILRMATFQPEIPQLLVVNLKDDDFISIPMLYVYLFFMENISKSTIVLFVSTFRPIRSISEINLMEVIGATSGQDVLLVLKDRFPGFREIWRFLNREDEFRNEIPSKRTMEYIRMRLQDQLFENPNIRDDDREVLSRNNVVNWFKGRLSNVRVNVANMDNLEEQVRKALKNKDKYILVAQEGNLQSVVLLCKVTDAISEKVLKEKSQP